MKAKSASKTEHLPHEVQTGDQVPAPQFLPASHSTPVFKAILVPIDFSDCSLRALDYALALATKFRARLILLHVIEPSVYPENYLITSATMDEANRNLIAEGREQLNKVKQRAAVRGLVAETLVRIGRAQSDIADTANATGADLIVMGAHGNSGLKQALLGGTTERVLRHSPCPVLTVPCLKQ
jgi:nucleotide-binding universal stress UspA family protein